MRTLRSSRVASHRDAEEGSLDAELHLTPEPTVNQPPVAHVGGPYAGNEGSPITMSAAARWSTGTRRVRARVRDRHDYGWREYRKTVTISW
jgi:hypothetical protein